MKKRKEKIGGSTLVSLSHRRTRGGVFVFGRDRIIEVQLQVHHQVTT